MRYPSERLLEEVAYLAYHFHWSYPHVMNMEHWERQQWVSQVAKINQQINQQADNNPLKF